MLRTLDADFRAAGLGPILHVAMPTACGAMGLTDAIAAALPRSRPSGRRPPDVREHDLYEDLAAARLGAIALDRAEELMRVPPERARRTVDCLLHVGRRAGASFVVAAPFRLAMGIMQSYNDGRIELGHAFRPVVPPRLHVDEEYLAPLDRYEGMLPLRHASDLAGRELALHLYALSDGLMGPLAGVMRNAAVRAIRTGAERITIGLLDEVGREPSRCFKGFRF